MKSKSFSFEGWNYKRFIRGRKKLIIAAVGYIGGFIVTSNPAISGIVAAGSELIYAILEYFLKEVKL